MLPYFFYVESPTWTGERVWPKNCVCVYLFIYFFFGGGGWSRVEEQSNNFVGAEVQLPLNSCILCLEISLASQISVVT